MYEKCTTTSILYTLVYCIALCRQTLDKADIDAESEVEVAAEPSGCKGPNNQLLGLGSSLISGVQIRIWSFC